MPGVDRVRPGIWSIPVPLPVSSLGYVLVYVFETDKGPYIVDAGWNTDEAYAALDQGLVEIGTSLSAVQGVLVTHMHPDHYGLAGRVREASGAWVALHWEDARVIDARHFDVQTQLEATERILRLVGVPDDEYSSIAQSAAWSMPASSFAPPDVLIEDFESPEVPGWDLLALWTPGHSPGHLCFWEPRHRVMLTGDHVLPRITPNISINARSGVDPLGDYLRSLDKVGLYEADEVLPAHEHRFSDLQARLSALRSHHDHRFGEVIKAIDDGVDTVWGVASRMTWSQPWEELVGYKRRSAVLEAYAHLRALEQRGVIGESVGEPSHWHR